MQTKQNIVLVHGAWADGSCWSKVILPLIEKGYNVTAAQLPLSSLDDDITVTRNLLEAQTGPTILIGHSYGGAVITGAATGVANVTALVYIAAFGLDEGESLESLSKIGPATAGGAHIYPDKHGFLWIDRAGFHEAFAADVDADEAMLMAAVQGPLSIKSFTAKSGPPAWKRIPSYYMVAENDQMIPPQAEEFMGKRMGATVRSVPSSHAAMVSKPEAVIALIVEAAEAHAGQSIEAMASTAGK